MGINLAPIISAVLSQVDWNILTIFQAMTPAVFQA